MQTFFDLLSNWFLHIDIHLAELATMYGIWIYLLLFIVILIETGLVLMPFLPGDSLLFVAGALAAKNVFDPWALFFFLSSAAIIGDAINFTIGTLVRKRAVDTNRIPYIKPAHIAQTHAYFEKHGGKTIMLARFVPIVRTLAPFVAAMGNMPIRTFFAYNIRSGILWIGSLLLAGHLFGTIPWVNKNLTIVILGIVMLSILPALLGWIRRDKPASNQA